MKRYFSYAIPIAFFSYVLIMLLFNLFLDGYTTFLKEFYQNLLMAIISGIIYVVLFFGFVWFNLKETVGYLESDSFDEPRYGHKLTKEIETKFNDFNQFKEFCQKHFQNIRVSEEKNAIKFLTPLFSLKRWSIGGIFYLNPSNGIVKVILIPYMGYSHKTSKQLNSEMDRIKKLFQV